MSPEEVREIAEEMIPSLCGGGKYRIFVSHTHDMRQHRCIEIWWDSEERGEDNRFDCRGTAVDISDTEEMVRYRIRSMFASDECLQRVGLYSCVTPIICDIPGENPPYSIYPEEVRR